MKKNWQIHYLWHAVWPAIPWYDKLFVLWNKERATLSKSQEKCFSIWTVLFNAQDLSGATNHVPIPGFKFVFLQSQRPDLSKSQCLKSHFPSKKGKFTPSGPSSGTGDLCKTVFFGARV